MVDALTGHPAADRETAEAIVVEQDRRVVPLSSWLADAAVTAAAGGRVLQVLTPARSRITYPLELLITDGHAQWVVRDGVERFRDGITGEPLRWNGARFTAAEGPAAPPVPTRSGSLEVQITTLHAADNALQLGLSTEAAMRALVGAAPAGWGVVEPASEPWSPRELTRHCHDRSPEPTNVVVVGGEGEPAAVGSLEVTRVDTGVRERLRLAGPASTAVGQDAIEDLAAAVAGKARSMLVASHPGRLDGLRWHTPTMPALPYGILVGHQVVQQRGVEHAQSAPAARVRILGLDRGRACWCRLDGGQKAPYELLTDVLRHFGLPD
ncbi:DUF6177 family protein [Saccharopolyspora erythraea]|uniref:Uncharacterized protein n=2 Tax=Saccharopolyspora erythraea TaxID=1836 RepID=A4F7A5_SACEN|nr:DUF6177 family protein [Saccharopolyspora erythraea]EQD86375.1 hypothetical protein N599_09925 [Saccharopolyspora erythraea D]QRK90570.1 hypothetical protein JQX30_03465 [Saccharopolyspora erythraea]CAL99929.1 hypothetical protein SACE_0584 [Saccharopolyspora erythraea NRRL 2338]